MINALRGAFEKWYLLNCGHSDNDRDRNAYDDVDCDGVGHNHVDSVIVGFPAKRQEGFVNIRRWTLKGKPKILWAPCPLWTGVNLSVLLLATSFSLSLLPLSSINWMTKHESQKCTKTKSESWFSCLLIWSDPSCWNWHPPLLFTHFSLKAIALVAKSLTICA